MKKKINKKRILTSAERKIIGTLYHTKVPMTTYALAKRTKVSYPTAKKYVTRLKGKNIIKTQTKNKKKLNYFNFNVLKRRR